MRFTQIPNIDSAWGNVKFTALSPSTFSWVNRGCGYRVMLQKMLTTFGEPSLSLPSNRNAILGTIIHKIYELTTKGELKSFPDLQHKWEELVAIEKSKLANTYPTLRNADINDYVKRNSAFRYAMQMMRNTPNCTSDKDGARQVFFEKWLDCSSLGLRGIADKIIVDGDYFDIVDYKYGHVVDDAGNIKEEYRVQLHLYAAMCQAQSMGTPRKLSLVDIAGIYYDVPYDADFEKSLLVDVQAALTQLNQAVRSQDFVEYTKPELLMCHNCSCRHICKYREIPPDSIYQTFTGTVSSIPSTNMYVLQSGGQTLYISGLDVYNVDNPLYYIGKKLTFLSVIKASQIADDNTFKITENTLVYEQL